MTVQPCAWLYSSFGTTKLGLLQAGRASRRSAVAAARSLHELPPVVLAAVARARLEVDLLPLVLADVADPQIAGRTVEGEAPGIAQSLRPDLVERAAGLRERIVRR